MKAMIQEFGQTKTKNGSPEISHKHKKVVENQGEKSSSDRLRLEDVVVASTLLSLSRMLRLAIDEKGDALYNSTTEPPPPPTLVIFPPDSSSIFSPVQS